MEFKRNYGVRKKKSKIFNTNSEQLKNKIDY